MDWEKLGENFDAQAKSLTIYVTILTPKPATQGQTDYFIVSQPTAIPAIGLQIEDIPRHSEDDPRQRGMDFPDQIETYKDKVNHDFIARLPEGYQLTSNSPRAVITTADGNSYLVSQDEDMVEEKRKAALRKLFEPMMKEADEEYLPSQSCE